MGYGRRGSYAKSVANFLGHLFGTAVMFVAILLVAWGLSYLVTYLHARHPFPVSVYRAVTYLEVGLVYIDVVVSAIVLFFGLKRFTREIAEELR